MTVRIPEELHRALKVKAAEQGKTMSVVVERLIRTFLQAPDPKGIRVQFEAADVFGVLYSLSQ